MNHALHMQMSRSRGGLWRQSQILVITCATARPSGRHTIFRRGGTDLMMMSSTGEMMITCASTHFLINNSIMC